VTNSVVGISREILSPWSPAFRPQLGIAADEGQRFERERERLPGDFSVPFPVAAGFSAEQMLTSSRAKPFGGSRLRLETISEKGGAAVASVTAPPDPLVTPPGSGTITLQIRHDRVYEPYGLSGATRSATDAVVWLDREWAPRQSCGRCRCDRARHVSDPA
jgi:hypothetical protein